MTSASDENWRPFNCFFSRVKLSIYQHPSRNITSYTFQTLKIPGLKTANGDGRLLDYIACWVDEELVENFDQKTKRGGKNHLRNSGLNENDIKAAQTFNKWIWEAWSGVFCCCMPSSGNSPASEFYMPTFRNTLLHLHRQAGAPNCRGITQKRAYYIQNTAKVWNQEWIHLAIRQSSGGLL